LETITIFCPWDRNWITYGSFSFWRQRLWRIFTREKNKRYNHYKKIYFERINGYSVESLTEFIENADIDFKNSKKTTDPQEYIFQNEGKTLVFAIPKDYDMPVYLVDSFDVECIECDTLSSTYDQDLKFPFRKKKW
jgi:hypothetical protein